MKIDLKVNRLKELIKRLEGSGDVSTSALTRVLTSEQLNNYHAHWKEELSLKNIQKPIEAKKYELMIKVASLHYQKMDKYSLMMGKARLAREFANKADSAFERAYEYLIEELHANPDLHFWIDRKPDPSMRCPIGIPRIIGSSSFECVDKRKYPYPVRTKKELKLHALESALTELTKHDLESLEGFVPEPEIFIPFSKPSNHDFSGFKF